MKLQIILGNQLFPVKNYDKKIPVFMSEDKGLCTHFKYHKHKIIFFLSSMRHFAKELESKDFEVNYFKLSDSSFFQNLNKKVSSLKTKEIIIYEIEDKFFETEISKFCKKNDLKLTVKKSPMFLSSREDFKDYLKDKKKPFMKSFYEMWRKSSGVLMEEDSPVGGKFSFDTENRKKIPKNKKVITNKIKNTKDDITTEVKSLVDNDFSDHPGDSSNFWLAVTRKDVLSWFNDFLKNRFSEFGDYEDAIDSRDPFLYHTVISPYINIGLIIPEEIIEKITKADVPINSKEGLIRQIAGWREFMRGVYQEYSDKQESTNFFEHKRKLTNSWYNGETGIAPLDDSIKKASEFGYCHHIERLMIISNLMLLSEIDPDEVYKWFMEMFVDSSDWVMVPNVYGMAQFSDGGIFATKPYIAGSNYIKKMSHYKKDDWCDVMDGLYWRFIDNKREFFKSNHRMKMMVSLFDKMDETKKKRIFKAANTFLEKHTT